MNRLIPDLPLADYYRDPCEQPSLNASTAHVLLSESPAHARQQHPRLGGTSKEPTESMDDGTLIHACLLGTVDQSVGVANGFANWRKDAAKDARAEIERAGKLAVLPHQLEHAREVAAKIEFNLLAAGIDLKQGRTEIACFWEETATDGTVVQCRGMFDHLLAWTISDVKKCASVHPAKLVKHMESIGADIQAAAYQRALRKVFPECQGREVFQWICIELEPPYAVTLPEPAGSMHMVGETLWQRAVDVWAQCLKTNTWPAYEPQRVRLEASQWRLAEAEMSV